MQYEYNVHRFTPNVLLLLPLSIFLLKIYSDKLKEPLMKEMPPCYLSPSTNSMRLLNFQVNVCWITVLLCGL